MHAAESSGHYTTEPGEAAKSSEAYILGQTIGQEVSTFDDDEDDLEIRLDKIEHPDPDGEVRIQKDSDKHSDESLAPSNGLCTAE